MEKITVHSSFVGNHVQPIGPRRQRFAFDGDGIAERDGRVYICARAPDLPVRNQIAPNLAVVHQRAMIGDRDVGDADALRNLGLLTLVRQIENECLRKAQTVIVATTAVRARQNRKPREAVRNFALNLTWSMGNSSLCNLIIGNFAETVADRRPIPWATCLDVLHGA